MTQRRRTGRGLSFVRPPPPPCRFYHSISGVPRIQPVSPAPSAHINGQPSSLRRGTPPPMSPTCSAAASSCPYSRGPAKRRWWPSWAWRRGRPRRSALQLEREASRARPAAGALWQGRSTAADPQDLAGHAGGDRRHDGSRVNFFMNKFRDLGFIECNGDIRVNSALLTVVLHD